MRIQSNLNQNGYSMFVYVLNIEGKPLMPCKPRRARLLLEGGGAKIINHTPFTIQLTYQTSNYTQPITLGVDAGSKHIGLSASTEKEELYVAQKDLRGEQIVKNLSERRAFRRSRRFRKTRYRKARFLNRTKSKKKGWVAPSVKNKIQSHLDAIEEVTKILPVTQINVEVAQFDIQKINNPQISGIEYQQGVQLGFRNVREYVLFRDNHKCRCCNGKSGDKILEVHHLESRKTGGNAPNNLITICTTCHKQYHDGKIDLDKKIKRGKSHKDATFIGIMRKYLWNKLKEKYPNLKLNLCYGYQTKAIRFEYNIAKSHINDAYCIAKNLSAKPNDTMFVITQVRKHNRQIYRAKILKKGIFKKAQAPYKVNNFCLYDKVKFNNQILFIISRRINGYFGVGDINLKMIKDGINFKKLTFLSHSKSNLVINTKRDIFYKNIISSSNNKCEIEKFVQSQRIQLSLFDL